MKKIALCITSICLLIGFSLQAQDEKAEELMTDALNAKQTLIEKNSDVEDLFNESMAYVIFPNVGKGAFIIGGASGKGILYENGSAEGMASLKKINVGLQAGGKAIIEVIFFENEKALNDFKDGNFQFDADVSAVVVESGAALNVPFKNGIAVIAMPKAGLMAGISVGGQKFDYESFGDTRQ